jgi:cytochrome c oxidase subunit 3
MSATHEHHWEWSWAPMAVVFGVFFLVPIAFAAFFVWESLTLTAVFAGLGTVLVLMGIAKWVDEGLTQAPIVEGLAAVALPVFIVSEIFIFLGLFTSYWTMRLSAPVWPPANMPEELAHGLGGMLPIIMTIVLVTSSVTIHIGEEKLEHGDLGGFRTWLILTLILGFVFLGMTIYEYQHLIHVGFIPSTNVYSSAFYSITGFHASHVLVGLCAFIAVLLPAMGGRTNKTFVLCVSVYWHFVDIVWFFVTSQIYFW